MPLGAFFPFTDEHEVGAEWLVLDDRAHHHHIRHDNRVLLVGGAEQQRVRDACRERTRRPGHLPVEAAATSLDATGREVGHELPIVIGRVESIFAARLELHSESKLETRQLDDLRHELKRRVDAGRPRELIRYDGRRTFSAPHPPPAENVREGLHAREGARERKQLTPFDGVAQRHQHMVLLPLPFQFRVLALDASKGARACKGGANGVLVREREQRHLESVPVRLSFLRHQSKVTVLLLLLSQYRLVEILLFDGLRLRVAAQKPRFVDVLIHIMSVEQHRGQKTVQQPRRQQLLLVLILLLLPSKPHALLVRVRFLCRSLQKLHRPIERT